MGQSSYLSEIIMENALKLKIQSSWVNRFIWPENASKVKMMGQSFISPRLAWKMHQNWTFKINGSFGLRRRHYIGKYIKTENLEFMGQSIYLAEIIMENA